MVQDYEINGFFMFETKEESLLETIKTKRISFTKDHSEIINLFDDYIDLKSQLKADGFKKQLLDELINKNKIISDFTQRGSNNDE
ncbi:hypothetical protein M976_02906 [Buttiauxella ferragutiae ATCC 51602]|uniref:Uncharacterized protein n=1 Tax=Buttiauxella ferragutiae ATCC 51602 TaxID=1354252 RepID=A0ABX2W5L7_9ENTR|nr:hypothetical protein M976_02906 [Buttiauxella ferragutiae ATCC 51602]